LYDKSLCYAQREYVFLHRRQAVHCLAQPFRRFSGDHLIEGAVLRRGVLVGHLPVVPACSGCSRTIAYQISRDREQPRAKRAASAKAVEGRKCSNERVLHQLLHVVADREARHESRDGPGVALHE
jgi:hypothetical protein